VGYQLGVDLGTTYTAAAVHRGGDSQIVELGNRTATIPSVIFLTDDGTILTGESANRRAVTEPGRVAREFKRRIGDPTPILLGGSPYSAESLSAQLLRWVIGKVTEREGEAPERIAVTHPANWGPYKLDLLHQAIRIADLTDVVTLTEPEAAAIHYSTLERIEAGNTVAVFDLGGGTFDAAILRKKAEGFEFLGQPEGIERLGGIDFDEAVFAFVTRSLGGAFESLDPTDANTVASVSRLRRDCVDAKEALSGDTEVTIPVVLPTLQTDVRLTRSEFEQMIRPSLADTIGAMQRAIRSADMSMDDIDLVLLVGGSSQIPLVGQMAAGELGRPVAVDVHPKHSIALGAARAAAASPEGAHLEEVSGDVAATAAAGATATSTAPETVVVPPRPESAAVPVQPVQATPVTPPAAPQAPTPSQEAPGDSTLSLSAPVALKIDDVAESKKKRLLIGAGALAVVAVIALGGLVLSNRGGDDGQTAGGAPTTTAGEEQDDPIDSTTTVTPTTSAGVPTTAVPTTAAPPTTVPEPTTTTTTEFVCPGGFCAHIDGITVDGGELIIEWTTFGYEPDTDNTHAHFFYNVWDVLQVGGNWAALGAPSVGGWQLTDTQPFSTAGSAVSIANAPAGTTAICVVPTDSSHGVISQDNFECVDIPPELLG